MSEGLEGTKHRCYGTPEEGRHPDAGSQRGLPRGGGDAAFLHDRGSPRHWLLPEGAQTVWKLPHCHIYCFKEKSDLTCPAPPPATMVPQGPWEPLHCLVFYVMRAEVGAFAAPSPASLACVSCPLVSALRTVRHTASPCRRLLSLGPFGFCNKTQTGLLQTC